MKVSIEVDNTKKKHGKGKVASVQVEGEKTECPGVSLTKRMGVSGYALTHVNTGRAITSGNGERSKNRLLKIAKKLAKSGIDFKTPKTVQQFRDAFAKADEKSRKKFMTAIHGNGQPPKERK